MKVFLLVVMSWCMLAGCRDYTENELIDQLYKRDKTFRQRIWDLQNTVSNRVVEFRKDQDKKLKQNIDKLSTAIREMQQIYRNEDANIRQWLQTGDLQKIRRSLIPTHGTEGYVAAQNGAFQGATFTEGNVVMHFHNTSSVKCKPSVRMILYDQNLEQQGDVKASWFWTSLVPEEKADEIKSLPCRQVPFYFTIENIK